MWDSLRVLCNSKGAFEKNRTLPGPCFRFRVFHPLSGQSVSHPPTWGMVVVGQDR